MFEPSFFAVTRTPSIAPSFAELTLPSSAAGAANAVDAPAITNAAALNSSDTFTEFIGFLLDGRHGKAVSPGGRAAGFLAKHRVQSIRGLRFVSSTAKRFFKHLNVLQTDSGLFSDQ